MDDVVDGPAYEPVTVDEVLDHLRMSDADRPWIERTIPIARAWCEDWLERSIAQKVYEWHAASFPAGPVALGATPALALVEVSYLDEAGVPQVADAALRGGFVHPVGAWPTGTDVRLRYIAGFSNHSYEEGVPLPPGIKGAILLMLGHFNENREATAAVKIEEVPLGVASLLERHRKRLSMA